MKYFVKSTEKPGFMLAGVGLGECASVGSVVWTQFEDQAVLLEEGEAEATITFIGDVLDWELAEELYIERKERN